MDTIIIGNDPSGQVTATFNGLGMPIGIKLSDAILSSGSEAASLAATQAMVDAHAKAQNAMMSKVYYHYYCYHLYHHNRHRYHHTNTTISTTIS